MVAADPHIHLIMIIMFVIVMIFIDSLSQGKRNGRKSMNSNN